MTTPKKTWTKPFLTSVSLASAEFGQSNVILDFSINGQHLFVS